MAELDSLLAVLRAYKREAGSQYRIEALGIFGSVARGDSHAGSDLDVVIRIGRPNLLTLSRIRLDLEERSGRHVDLLRYRDGLAPLLKERVDREARYV